MLPISKLANSDMHEIAFQTSSKDIYDAIVIGSGISGGWAAKELCEKGLKTLVLERGKNLDQGKEMQNALKDPWKFEHHNIPTQEVVSKNPTQSKCYAWNEGTQHLFVNDEEHPYSEVKPFDWIRGYQVGGKSIMWARQCYRWNEQDFEANAREGIGIDWPIRYSDIAPWYSYVERFVGINGNRDGLPQVPDGEFQPAMEMNCAEKEFKQRLESAYPGRHLIMGRSANHTRGMDGRGPCQYRNLCHRGCPFKAYFSSVSATLPAAAKTGNYTLRPDSIVHSIIYDDKKEKATGVRVIDASTLEMREYYARIIFLNASTLNSNLLLLNSTSKRFPEGLGNDSGTLGKYIMVHNYRIRATGVSYEFADKDFRGRRPNAPYIPRFRNFGNDLQSSFLRGYSFNFSAYRQGWQRGMANGSFGAEMKEELSRPGPWEVFMTGQGETLPDESNRVSIDRDKVDKWGMPILQIDCEWKENDEAMTKDIALTAREIYESIGLKEIDVRDSGQSPGLDIHEMGGVRMGRDPKTSMLNGFNQLHSCPNVFVTDGACMTSAACQNPSVTYMALTARACDYAVKSLRDNKF